jgi:hypothetical protein
MTITARHLAWLEKIGISTRQYLGLAFMETSLILAWAVLLDSILRFFTSLFLNALPLTVLLSANILALLESPRVSRMSDPLTAMGLAEVDGRGRLPSGWRTLLRVLLTPLSLLLFMAGFIPVFFGRRSLPEAAAGVRLVYLDPSHDPRPRERILEERKRNRKMVLGYTLLSLMMAGLILFVPLPGVNLIPVDRHETDLGLSAADTELLTLYLEMKQRFPDSIEYHVRLASLYYRNDMDADLASELREIARLDPDHPLLLLAEDFDVDLSSLMEGSDGFPEIEETGFGPGALDLPQPPDSTTDSTSVPGTAVTTVPQAADSTSLPADDPTTAAPAEPPPTEG